MLADPEGGPLFDSLAVDTYGNICVATIRNGGITVVTPDGMHFHRPFPDPITTNICFGGADLSLAFVTLSGSGRLVCRPWESPGPRAGILTAAKALASAVIVVLLGTAAGVGASVLAPLPAAAHSTMLQASPGPSQIAGGPIDVVDLTFTEPVSEAEVRVKNGDGEFLPGSMAVADGQIIRFVFDEPLNEPGEYEVDYEVISWDGDPGRRRLWLHPRPHGPHPPSTSSATTPWSGLPPAATVTVTGRAPPPAVKGSDGASGGRTFATILILVALLVSVVAVAVTVLRWVGPPGRKPAGRPGRGQLGDGVGAARQHPVRRLTAAPAWGLGADAATDARSLSSDVLAVLDRDTGVPQEPGRLREAGRKPSRPTVWRRPPVPVTPTWWWSTPVPSSTRPARNRSTPSSSSTGTGAPGARLVVTGCMAERYGAELSEALPEVSAVAPFGASLTADAPDPRPHHGRGAGHPRPPPAAAPRPTPPPTPTPSSPRSIYSNCPARRPPPHGPT